MKNAIFLFIILGFIIGCSSIPEYSMEDSKSLTEGTYLKLGISLNGLANEDSTCKIVFEKFNGKYYSPHYFSRTFSMKGHQIENKVLNLNLSPGQYKLSSIKCNEVLKFSTNNEIDKATPFTVLKGAFNYLGHVKFKLHNWKESQISIQPDYPGLKNLVKEKKLEQVYWAHQAKPLITKKKE